MEKSSKHTVNQRINEVVDMLIEGRNRFKIIQYGSTYWNIGERQIDKYIARARDLIQLDVKKNIEYDYAKAIRRYEELYNKAIENEDYRLALSINKEISTIQGLHKIQIEHSGDIEFISNIPD